MKIDLSQKNIFRFSSFIELLTSCFNSYFGVDKATFCAAYPNISPTNQGTTDLQPPIFTYKYKKVPSIIGSVEKNQELKPRIRGSEKITLEDGNTIYVEVSGQRFTYTLIIELWALNGQEAEIYTEKFQDFMNSYSSYFIDCGIENLIFLEVDPDQISNQWRSDLIRRQISYRIDIDELVNVQRTDIKSILAEIKPSFNYSFEVLEP